MNTPQKILFLLKPVSIKKISLLLILVLLNSFVDILGIASILPFVTILTNPEIIETNFFLASVYEYSKIFGVKTIFQFLFFLGIAVFVLLIISLFMRGMTTYALIHFTLTQEFIIGKKLLEGYLNQPYSWFLNKNSSDIIKNILSEIRDVLDKTVLSSLNILVYGTSAIAILILLLIVNLNLAINIGAILFFSYILIFLLVKNFLSKIGNNRLNINSDRFKIITEAFSATKEIKLRGLENEFTNRFINKAKNYAKINSLGSVFFEFPKYIIEAVIFGGMIIIILFFIASGTSFSNILPIIALYAFAGYRLIPSMQIVYSSFSMMRFIGPTLDMLIKDLNDIKNAKKNFINKENILYLEKSIELKNICFIYPNSDKQILNDINLIIKSKQKIGIIGPTGCGKTTLVDLLLGLLRASSGMMFVDQKLINDNNIRSWQENIGYVPQNVFLSDSSIYENIAFGINSSNIDKHKVVEVAKIANIHQFIVDSLPGGYETHVGERGVRLSGGQIQRIGIARALYRKPQLLIFDESTSALDNITERVVMDAIYNLGEEVTIIIIAHRLSTVKYCDKILVMDKGKLISQGTYSQLKETNEMFKKMSGLNL